MSADSVIQFTSFPASEAYIKDDGIVSEGLEKVKAAEGHVSTYWGLQVPEEGGKRGYLVTLWDSSEHYKNFTKTDLFTSAMSSLKLATAGEVTRHQFSHVIGTPLIEMQSGVTEFVYITPKDGVSDSAIKEAADKLDDVFNANGHPASLAESVEGHGVYLIVVGWPSYVESRASVPKEPFATPIAEFKAIAHLEVSHAILDKHN